jgi:hypothetical protein
MFGDPVADLANPKKVLGLIGDTGIDHLRTDVISAEQKGAQVDVA